MPSVRQPGRPRAFDSSEVLDTALELFWSRGFVGTTTRDLEKAVGLSQSSLYNAFGSKRQLLDAALDRYETRLTTELLAPLESGTGGLAAIDEFLEALGAWLKKGRRGCMLVNIMAEDGGQSPEISERTRGHRRRIREAFDAALERAAAANEVSGLDGRAHLLLGVVLGLNIVARGGASTAEIASIVAGAREQVARWRTSSSG